MNDDTDGVIIGDITKKDSSYSLGFIKTEDSWDLKLLNDKEEKTLIEDIEEWYVDEAWSDDNE